MKNCNCNNTGGQGGGSSHEHEWRLLREYNEITTDRMTIIVEAPYFKFYCITCLEFKTKKEN